MEMKQKQYEQNANQNVPEFNQQKQLDKFGVKEISKRFFNTLTQLNNFYKSLEVEPEYSNIMTEQSIFEKIGKEIKKHEDICVVNESELNYLFALKVIKSPNNLFKIMNSSKSYLFDILKRKSRFGSFLTELQTILEEQNYDTLNKITQLEFIILFVNMINEKQQGQIGNWISRGNYPVPLFVRKNEIEYKFMFQLQEQCYENLNPLVVNFGTSSTKRSGKTRQILSLLGENKSNLNFYMIKNEVGLIHENSILAYYHLYQQIQLIDVNYEAVNSMLQLNKEFLRGVLTVNCFSSIKIIHVMIEHDFDIYGYPKDELKQILAQLCINPSIHEKYKRFIFVYRDFSQSQNELKNKVNENLKRILGIGFSGEISIPNLKDSDESKFISQISKISQIFLPILNRLILEKVNSYDFEFLQQFYHHDSKEYFASEATNIEFKKKYLDFNNENKKKIKKEFQQLEYFEKLFPLQSIDKQQQDLENQLLYLKYQTNRYIANFTDDKIEKKKTQLNQQIEVLQRQKQKLHLSIPVQNILDLVKLNLQNIRIIENALIEWKIPKIIPIRKKYGDLLQQLQKAENRQVNSNSNDITQQIKELDTQINNLDISFETICQEVISSIPVSDLVSTQIQQMFESLTEQQLLTSQPVNIVDGKTLQFGNCLLEKAILKLNQEKKVYVISIIGAQSSAKSTLLNFLFGCGFQTSQGRCTKGMYISILNYSNFYILLLDTEGLLSVQARDTTFDNQVCTMAFALSNIVLFNNKGELTTVQKNLLEVCMYALSVVCQARSKPKIIFCQRDQSAIDPVAQQQILTELLRHLNEAGRNVGINVEDLVQITRDDLFLLTSAFISTVGMNQKEVFYLNDLFPQQIMKLRHYIILYFISQNQQIVSYQNIKEFYYEGKQIWELILKNGQSVLELKSVIEQKIKLDLEQVGNQYAKKNYQDLKDLFKITYERHKEQEKFSLISEQFNQVLAGFIEKGKREFHQEVLSSKYGDNPTWKDQAMEEIISLFKFYKDQEEMFYKKKHSKQRSQSDLEKLKKEIQDRIQQLIDKNQTKGSDFDRMFEELISNKFNQEKELFKLCESEESQKNILQKIYYAQTQETKSSQKRVQQRIIRVGIYELFSFVINEGKQHIDLIMQKYDPSSLPQNITKILNELLFGSIGKKIIASIFKSQREEENMRRKLLNVLKQYISEIMNSLQKENDQIQKVRDMNAIISNTISSIQNHQLSINSNKLIPYLEKLGFYIIYQMQISSEKQELNQFQTQVRNLIQEQRQLCREVFDDAIDISEKGKNAANFLAKQLIGSFENMKQSEIETKIIDRIYDQFPTPKSLNDQAYQISFRNRNFHNIIRYIVNIKSLIMELCQPVIDKQRDWIETNRKKFNNEITDIFQEVQNELARWKDCLKDNQYKILSSVLKENKILSQHSKALSIEIFDTIATREEFIKGFTKQFSNEQGQLSLICEGIVSKLIVFSEKEVKQKSINSQGCEARCPYCNNKCSENGHHSGNHKVVQHLPIGFRGYHSYETKKMCYRRCIDKEMYDYTYHDHDPSYEKDEMVWIPLDDHISKFHETWRESIPAKNEGNNDTEETRVDVIIGWEGTKQYFIEKYEKLDEPREDWSYIFNESGLKRLTSPFDEYD